MSTPKLPRPEDIQPQRGPSEGEQIATALEQWTNENTQKITDLVKRAKAMNKKRALLETLEFEDGRFARGHGIDPKAFRIHLSRWFNENGYRITFQNYHAGSYRDDPSDPNSYGYQSDKPDRPAGILIKWN